MSFGDALGEGTNDQLQLTPEELMSIYGTSSPAGRIQINSVKAPTLYGDTLIVQGNVYIYGCIMTPLRLCAGIYFGDGTEAMPSIAFASDPSTGLYRAGPGLIGFTSGGVTDMIVGDGAVDMEAPITTTGGANLVLNPSGGSVDFTGHTLINVGGISVNPNYYNVIAPASVTTTNAVPTVLLTIATVSNAVYQIAVTIAVADDTDSTSSAGFSISTVAKNVGGVVTLLAPYTSDTQAIDAGLAGISVAFAASGTNITIVGTGLGATTIKWFSAAVITRQLF